jgi:glycosyltransferase involved in cell wall biosynthesis
VVRGIRVPLCTANKASGKPAVSVVVLLNAERFIGEAIESVFTQTHGSWELLLVDEGSTDSGTRRPMEYTERRPRRVRRLEHRGHKNRRMSASRDLRIRRAEGAYTAFLDADIRPRSGDTVKHPMVAAELPLLL